MGFNSYLTPIFQGGWISWDWSRDSIEPMVSGYLREEGWTCGWGCCYGELDISGSTCLPTYGFGANLLSAKGGFATFGFSS